MVPAGKGIVVEFDFAVVKGADLLFDITKAYLDNLDGIPFNTAVEARYLAGGNYLGGLAEYFAAVRTKKTAQKAARELDLEFRRALTAAVPKAVGVSFVNFIRTLSEREVKVVIVTRADLAAVTPAFQGLLGDRVALYGEPSLTYGSVKWDAWRRACVFGRLLSRNAIAVTGSGLGVKAALLAGMGAVAVNDPHVAYQDFSGADAFVNDLGAPAARKIIELLRV